MVCTDTCCRPYDDGGPDVLVLSTKYPVARKTYRCMTCGKDIPPGTPYVREFALVDGVPGTTILHDPNGYCADWD